MDAQNTSFLIHFRQLEDPRLNRKKRHRTIGLAAMVMVCKGAGPAGGLEQLDFRPGSAIITSSRRFIFRP